MIAARERAVRDALDFFRDLQCADGAWRDFEVDRTDESDAWVTGYVGAALAGLDERAPTEALARARGFLLEALAGRAGWGFNAAAPPDADSTAWATLALAASGGAPSTAYDALRAHRHADGGYATYVRFADPSMWRTTQADVSAAALCAASTEPAGDPAALATSAAALRAAQRPDGSWDAFWYTTPFYVTALAVRALDAAGDDAACAHAVARARAWARAQPLPIDDPFALAFAAELAASDGRTTAAAEAAGALVAAQRPDGRWTAARAYMLPDPWNYAPGDPDAAIADPYGIFTTAAVLGALARA